MLAASGALTDGPARQLVYRPTPSVFVYGIAVWAVLIFLVLLILTI